MGRPKKTTEEAVQEFEEMLSEDKTKRRVEFISSGSTMLNLASSQRGRTGGWPRGRIVRIVGDGSSGKTLLALEACAHFFYKMKDNESENFPKVKNVRVVYNNCEGVLDFPIEEMYGEEFSNGVEWKSIQTVEELSWDICDIIDNMKDGDSILYIVDSWDTLKSITQMANFEKEIDKRKEESDGYNISKPTFTTRKFLPELAARLDSTNKNGKQKDFTFIAIAQTRENLNRKSIFDPKKVVSGGSGWLFWTQMELWLREVRKITKTVRGREKAYGVEIEANFKRNKVSLPFRKASAIIYFSVGLDDVGGMLNWLFNQENSKSQLSVSKSDLEAYEIFKNIEDKKKYTEQYLISYIEDNDLEEELQDLVEKLWLEDEEKIKVVRKKRF